MIDTEVLFSKASQIGLFASLTDQELRELLLECQIALFLKGKTIFREGALGDSLMVLLQGCISLRCSPEPGVSVELATLEEGAVLGEMAVIDPAPRAATAVAVTNAVLLIMAKDSLDRMISAEHPGASKVLRQVLLLLAGRFRAMEDRIGDLFTSRIGQQTSGAQAAWHLAPRE
jgi:CRP-like cAMP-binding protein